VTGTASGQIFAGAGSVVRQDGVTLSGIINTSGTGIFKTKDDTTERQNVRKLNGHLHLKNNERERVTPGGLVSRRRMRRPCAWDGSAARSPPIVWR